jgi:cellulose synthase/poly-beta-1,6-N-acetylglucosamine synthase-like glycosyltransferase
MIYFPLAPVTLTHIALGIFRWTRTAYTVVAPYEKTTVIIPVYNEEKDITTTLQSVLNQTEPPDQIIISDNGSQDETCLVIDKLLIANGYTLRKIFDEGHSDLRIGEHENGKSPSLIQLQHRHQTSKADSINEIQKYGFIKNSRTLTIDSDTILDPRFIERMNENWYTLRIYRNRVVVTKAEILGATVLPKKNRRAGLQERAIAMAREAEYTFGQILVRNGQNLTALYVTPGCGFMCRTDKLILPDRTVTEDLELTQTIQSERKTYKLSKSNLKEFISEGFQVKVNNHLVPLVQFLQELGKPVYFVENNAAYVDSAFMYTQDPMDFKNLFIQIGRWCAGFHEVLFLQGKKFRKGNKRLLFTIYGAKFEGLVSSVIFLLLPILVFVKIVTGYGVDLKFIRMFYLFDGLVQIPGVILSLYRRNRLQGSSVTESAKYSIFKSVPIFLFLYILRFLDSLQFLRSYLMTVWETKVLKKTNWNSQWERPH